MEYGLSYICGRVGVFCTERGDQNSFHIVRGEDRNFFHVCKGGPVFLCMWKGGGALKMGSGSRVTKVQNGHGSIRVKDSW